MRALLDANFLIALLDGDHVFHEAAHEWFAGTPASGWASCPMTENAVVRVMANPKYSRIRQFDIEEIVLALKMFRAATDHHFWPDEVSITDDRIFDTEKIHGPGQLTDAYLLAIAVTNGGCLVTFDRRISTSVVPSAQNEHLLVVENR